MIRNKNKEIEINEVISWMVRVLLILVIIESIFTKNYMNTFVGFLTFVMTFYPSILRKRFRVYLPASLQIIITLFIFAAQFLGEIHDFYYRFPWWDNMLHCISGSVLGIIGFMFVYFLNKTHIKKTKLSPFFVALFAFCFALSIGVFWEIFEFTGDRLLGLNMQKFRMPGEDGLVDTMTDLIVDTIGALIVTIIGYVYMKDEKRMLKKKVKIEEWFKKQAQLEIDMENEKSDKNK